MSQQTENYNFNLIETTDKITDSLNDLNDNFEALDDILNQGASGISSYVKDNLDYSTPGNDYALSAYQGYVLKGLIDAVSNNYNKISSSISTSLAITNSFNGKIQGINLYGNTEQNGTPTTSSPVAVEVVSGDVTLNVSDGINTQTQLISLGTIELCRIGSYQDYIYKTGEKWFKHEAIRKYTLTGQESFGNQFGTNLFNVARLFDDAPFVVGYGLSNYFTYNSAQSGINSATTDGQFALQKDTSTQTGYNLFIKNTSYSDATNFKAWLASVQPNIYYPRATAIDIEITDSALVAQLENILTLETYKGNTNVTTTTSNLNPYIMLQYFGDDKVSSASITNIWKGTQTEYDNLGTYSNTTLYLIEEE